MHPQVEAVIAELDAHRERYETFCRSLSEEQLIRPVPQSSWVVKDFISHLATIDEPVARFFASVHNDGKGRFSSEDGGALNIDTWNDHTVAQYRDQSVDAIFEVAAKSRSTLRDIMMEFTQDDLDHEFTFGGDSKRGPASIKFGQYLAGWCKHDPMHAVDMMRAMPERMTPELQAWFDDPVVQGYQAQMNRA